MSEVPEELAARELFELESFAHRALFEGTTAAWQALERLRGLFEASPKSAILGRVAAGAWLEGEPIIIGEGTIVEPGAYIQAPCIIGRDCQVRHGAYLRGLVVAGDRAVIGHATEIKSSIMLDDAKAGHFAYIGDSILGNRVNLGAGTKLANLRLDDAVVRIRFGSHWIDSGRRKLGAILADDAETGCNSVTNPGTVLGRGARLLPCETASGYQPPGSRVARRRD